MSRRQRRPWFGGNTTLAGALVTVTACLVTAGTVATGCVLMVQGHVDDGRETLLQGGTFLAAAVALLSRTRQDPAATIDPPATVTASTTEQPADAGAGELRFIGLIAAGIVAGAVLLYLLREVVTAVVTGG